MENSDFDLELPVLPPEVSIPPKLSFHEHLRFCSEYRHQAKLKKHVRSLDHQTPSYAEFVM